MNKFLTHVIREREKEQEKDIVAMEPRSLAVPRGRPPMGRRQGIKVDEELRQRILERALQPGFKSRIAEEFGVSKSFVSDLLKEHREGSAA